jgi:DNA-binding LytR/AlgR family response regulator
MPTALIADDEPNLATDLGERLGQLWPQLKIVALVPNGLTAVSELGRLRPDLAFLDIRMPGLSGLQVAQSAGMTRVVFITAFEEYALSAFDVAAVDYLLKPVSDARLAQCVVRLQSTARPDVDWQGLAAFLSRPTPGAPPIGAMPPARGLAWLTVGLAGTTRLIAVEEVLYFQSCEKYTEAVTARERHVIRTPLRELDEQLDPAQFARIHRATIVNLAAVDRIEGDLLGRRRVHLKGSLDVLTLSRSFADRFRQM